MDRVGRYRIFGRLGAGGMGQVHLARAYGAEGVVKDLCVKLIRGDRLARPSAIARFVEEARLWAGLHHANIVNVFDFGRSDDGYYLAMEWVDGPSARTLVADGPLPPDVAAHVGAEVARALEYAHARQPPLIHRDVKPANVLVSRSGDVKLGDFGVAALAGSSMGAAGTPGYIAPEQEAGAAERRSDLWALGVVLCELASGEREPSRLEDPELRALAERLTAHDPAARPGSASEVANELEGYVARARAQGACSPREQLAERARALAPRTKAADGELRATESFARDGDEALALLSGQTTAGPSTGSSAPAEPRLPRARLAVTAIAAMIAAAGGLLIWRAVSSEPPPAGAPAAQSRPREDARAPSPSPEPAPDAVTAPAGQPPADEPDVAEPPTAVVSAAPEPPPASRPAAVAARARRRRPARPARVSVNAVPWARVYVDGREVGVTPLFDLELPAGAHRLRFVNEPLGAVEERRVVARAGQVERLIVRLGEPSPDAPAM